MFHDRNERCFGKKTTKRSQYSFWIRPQHENMNSKWFYYWSHAHQNQADWETLWPNLQLLSLVLLNVMWWYAAKRPGYFFYLESYKSNENGLGFTNLLIFVLSLYDLSEPRTLGWPLPRVTSILTQGWCRHLTQWWRRQLEQKMTLGTLVRGTIQLMLFVGGKAFLQKEQKPSVCLHCLLTSIKTMKCFEES